ncbi:MAG TPA: hypothetical protein VF817_04265 [Patescibacteria group bacterium]
MIGASLAMGLAAVSLQEGAFFGNVPMYFWGTVFAGLFVLTGRRFFKVGFMRFYKYGYFVLILALMVTNSSLAFFASKAGAVDALEARLETIPAYKKLTAPEKNIIQEPNEIKGGVEQGNPVLQQQETDKNTKDDKIEKGKDFDENQATASGYSSELAKPAAESRVTKTDNLKNLEEKLPEDKNEELEKDSNAGLVKNKEAEKDTEKELEERNEVVPQVKGAETESEPNSDDAATQKGGGEFSEARSDD